MKLCKSCNTKSNNDTYEGDFNPYNKEHCEPCALILHKVDLFEEILNRPNIKGHIRKVKLTAKITKI